MGAIWRWLYVYPMAAILLGAGALYLGQGALIALIIVFLVYQVWTSTWGFRGRKRRARRR
jgi:hypothetical protein